MENKKTAVAILSNYSFPYGLAPTTRILSYSKGIIENGGSVDVFNHGSHLKSSGYERSKSGIYQEISYHFTFRGYRFKYKILRKLIRFTGYRFFKAYILCAIKMYRENKKKKFKCMLICSDSFKNLFFYSYLAKILRIYPIFIFDEYPIPIRHKLKTRIPRWKELLFKIALKKISAYISISETLKEYYCNLISKPTHILSVITDISRFNFKTNINNSYAKQKYLCYMGNMELAKDDVDNIIRAFSLISDRFGDLYLYLYGKPSNETKTILNNLISKLKLENRVIIKGRVNNTKVPEILEKAYILVSSQPDTVRASGGFPTKLGEYLASGTPTLLTNVGENASYVKHRVHLFFANPNNINDYAEELKYIIENYQEALDVAKNGKKYIYENYSHVVQGRKLLKFIKSL